MSTSLPHPSHRAMSAGQRKIYRKTVTFVLRIARSYFGFTVVGQENIPRTGGVIIACNHSSYLDPPLVAGACDRLVRAIAKQELFRNPLLGMALTNLGSIAIDQKMADPALAYACQYIKSGGALMIFPEGTRSKDGRLSKLKPGFAQLAMAVAGCPIVPTVIVGAHEAMPKASSLPKRRRITVVFGEPYTIDQFTPIENRRNVPVQVYFRELARLSEKMSDLLPESMRPDPVLVKAWYRLSETAPQGEKNQTLSRFMAGSLPKQEFDVWDPN